MFHDAVLRCSQIPATASCNTEAFWILQLTACEIGQVAYREAVPVFHDSKADGGVAVKTHVFLTSALLGNVLLDAPDAVSPRNHRYN